jgi:ABC-type transport system involved in multi-copper enzyme maturation permease subunit
VILKYEIKKILSRRGTLIALLVLFMITVCSILYSIHYPSWDIDDNTTIHGIKAIKMSKQEKSKNNAIITEEVVSRIINEYKDISNNSIDGTLSAEGWLKIQYIDDLVVLIDNSFGSFHDFNYYLCGQLSTSQSNQFYQNRIKQIKEWANSDENDALRYTQEQKEYFIRSAETLETPFTYSYMEGWKEVFNGGALVLFCVMLILCIIIAPVFCNEYQSGMDNILMSSQFGKTKVAYAKVLASYIITTVVYWSTVLLYNLSVLLVYGTDGASCIIQTNRGFWKSFYHLTNIQALGVSLGLAYLGSLLMVSLTMLISSKAKTSFEAIIIPFVVLIIPLMINTKYMPKIVEDIMNLFPNNTADSASIFREYNVYQFGDKVFSQCQMILVVYLACILILLPITLRCYRKHKIN